MVRIGVSKVKTGDLWRCLCLWIGAGGFGVDISILASWLAYVRNTTDLLLSWLPKGGRHSYRVNL